MKVLRLFLLAILSFLFMTATIVKAAETNSFNITAFLNGQNIDKAQTNNTAIIITNPQIEFGWVFKNNSKNTLNLSKVIVDLPSLSFFPNEEFSVLTLVKPSEEVTDSKTINIPNWILSLKGYQTVRLSLYTDRDRLIAQKRFKIYLGNGNALTGVPGVVGASAGVIAAAAAVGAVATESNLLAFSSAIALDIAVALISFVLGIGGVDTLIGAFQLGTAAGVGEFALLIIFKSVIARFH